MKKTTVFWTALAVCWFGLAAQAEVVDITKLVRDQSVAVVVTGTVSNAGYMPPKAFDGNFTTETGRWLGAKPFPPAFIDYHLPASWEAGKSIVLSSYTVIRMPASAYFYVERMPTAFTLSGSNDGGATWTELDSRTNVDWNVSLGTVYSNVYAIASPASYRSYRFRALASSSTDTYPVGLGELVFSGAVVSSAGQLEVAGSPSGMGTVSPGYGTLSGLPSGTSFVCTATSPFGDGATLYDCIGHVLETLGGEGWENPVTNAASSFLYTHGDASARLTWLWAPIAHKLTAAPANGTETVTAFPGPDTNGYYTAGAPVELTPNPNATPPTSAFLRWHGDVPAGHEEDNPLTVTMDAPKSLVPEFKRHWVYAAGTPATITDGNWTLKVFADGSGGPDAVTIGSGSVSSILAGSGLLDLADVETDLGRGVRVNDRAFIYNNNITALVYPPGAAKSGYGVCYQCAALQQVTLSGTMTNIEGSAFSCCSSLTTVEPFLPTGVTAIAASAFDSCFNLTGALACTADGLKAIGDHAFWTTRIDSLRLSGTVESVGIAAFAHCSKLTNVVFEGNSALKTLGDYCFNDCASLATVEPFLPTGVTTIGIYAFDSCFNLGGALACTADGLKAIGDRTFWTTRIDSLRLSQTVGSIGISAFAHTALTNVVFEGDSALGTLKDTCFYDCAKLTTMTPFLPGSVTNIGTSTFEGTPVGGRLTLSSPALTTIGVKAFYSSSADLDKITEMVLPPNLATIQDVALYNTASLTNVCFLGKAPVSVTRPFGETRAPAAYGLVIHAHPPSDQEGWAALTTPLTTEEAAVAPAKCFGTWRVPINSTGTTTRKYWLVYWTPPQLKLRGSVISLQ